MKSRSRKSAAGACFGRASLLALGVCAVLLGGVPAPASDVVKVYLDPDGDGNFDKIREYPVSPQQAVRAFQQAGGAPWDGIGERLTFDEQITGVSFPEAQSWDGFLAFMDQNYRGGVVASNQLCGSTINFTSNVDCTTGRNCTVVTNCTNGTPPVTFPSFSCIAEGVPPCPLTGKDLCQKTGIQPVFFGYTVPACTCRGGAGGICEPQGGPIGVMHTGDVCGCAPPAVGRPALPGWAGIALAGLLFVAGIFVFGKRRTETQKG